MIESEKVDPFVSKDIFVNIARTIVTAPIGPLLRLISLLAKSGHRLETTRRRTLQRRDTRKLTQRRTIERAWHNGQGRIGWDAPIYKQYTSHL